MTRPGTGSACSGFPAATVGFLDELRRHNERAWFQANKHRYEACVLDPALAFIADMGPRLERVSKHFVAIPKRVGGSLMRIHRDTRFSRNKAPYKTNIGIQFRHELGRDVHAPGFYVHIAPDECFVGVGAWRPERRALTAIRDRLVEDPAGWRRALRARRFRERFELAGERLKRPPRGYPAEHPCLDDLKRKDFIAVTSFEAGDAEEASFTDRVAADFAAARPFMRFLCAALAVPF